MKICWQPLKSCWIRVKRRWQPGAGPMAYWRMCSLIAKRKFIRRRSSKPVAGAALVRFASVLLSSRARWLKALPSVRSMTARWRPLNRVSIWRCICSPSVSNITRFVSTRLLTLVMAKIIGLRWNVKRRAPSPAGCIRMAKWVMSWCWPHRMATSSLRSMLQPRWRWYPRAWVRRRCWPCCMHWRPASTARRSAGCTQQRTANSMHLARKW